MKRANQLNFYRSVKQSATTYFPFRFIEACTRSEVIERQTSEEENGKSYSNLTEWEREILKKVLRSGVKSEEKLHLFKQQSLNFSLHFCFASVVLMHREWGKFCLHSDDEWLFSGLGERLVEPLKTFFVRTCKQMNQKSLSSRLLFYSMHTEADQKSSLRNQFSVASLRLSRRNQKITFGRFKWKWTIDFLSLPSRFLNLDHFCPIEKP